MPATAEALGAAYLAAQEKSATDAAQLAVGFWMASQVVTGEESTGGGIDILAAANDWLDRTARLLEARQRQAASLARSYYRAARRLEVPGAPAVEIPSFEPVSEQLRSSMWFVGPYDYLDGAGREGNPGWSPSSPERQKQIAGSVERLALAGGRQQIQQAIVADSDFAVGYSREIRSQDPCWLCIMLASRGIVFSEDSFDASDPRFVGEGSDVKVHDSCSCGFLAHFTGKRGDHPGKTQEALEIWESRPGVDRNRPGDTEQKAFRRYIDARRRAQAVS